MTAPNRETASNRGQTTLNGSINNSVTSITVTDGSVFPSSGNFRILIESELLVVTARSSNTLTVVRAQEGTSAASHADLLPVTHILTADGFDRFGKDNVPLWGESTAPPLNKLVDTDGKSLLTTSDFSWTNQGGASVSDLAGTILLRAPASSGTNFRIFRRAAPSPPWTLVTAVRPHVQGIDGSSNSSQLGICCRESSTGKFITLAVNRKNTDPMRFAIDHWTNETTYGGSTPYLGKNQCFIGNVMWLRIIDDNTNLKFAISDDGVEFIQVLSQSRTALMSGGANQVGIAVNNGGDSSASDALLRLLHFRTE